MPDLKDPALYHNRELSWLAFNRRVLEEAMDPTQPLLERLKFLSIVDSNLTEFFEVRVARLHQQVEAGVEPPGPDRLPAREQLKRIGEASRKLIADLYVCWNEQVRPALEQAGIRVVPMTQLDEVQSAFCTHFFDREVGPVLTPFTLDPAHPLPHLVSQALCLAVLLEDEGGEKTQRLGIVPVPRVLPRLVRLPGGMHDYVTLADLAAAYVGRLYLGRRILAVAPFRADARREPRGGRGAGRRPPDGDRGRAAPPPAAATSSGARSPRRRRRSCASGCCGRSTSTQQPTSTSWTGP